MQPDSIRWDFGDGSFSSALNPSHTYAAAGTYTVKAKARKGNMVRYFNRTVTITASPVANQPQNMVACVGTGGNTATFNLGLQNAAILGTQPAADFVVSYHLTQQDAELGINALPLQYANVANMESGRITTLTLPNRNRDIK